MNDSLEYNTTVGQISVSNTPALSDYITKREASSPAERKEFKLGVRCERTSDSPVLRLLLLFFFVGIMQHRLAGLVNMNVLCKV